MKGPLIAAVLLSAVTSAAANPWTYCADAATHKGEMGGPLQPHIEGDPLFFMQDFQEMPKQQQFGDRNTWTNGMPWCHREDCENYIATLF